MTDGRALPEFVRVTHGRRVALVHPDFVPHVSSALFDGRGVWPTGVQGRGEMLGVSTPQGDVIIREYLRGGMVARFLRNAYFLDNRPLKELHVHQHAWRSGVPTVMPLGVMWERSGFFYSGAYATLRVKAEDLLTYLRRVLVGQESEPSSVLASCGRAIRAMHSAGIYHHDLQVKNILVSAEQALIIDFDGARLTKFSDVVARNNLARLRRSFVKRGLSLRAFESIVDGYQNP